MKLILNRYEGNRRVTKAHIQVILDGEVKMECEAREPRFDRYTESFPGCSQSCLAEGEWQCKPVATRWSPMTPTIIRSPGHRCCRFIPSDGGDCTPINTVAVGQADNSSPECGLINGKKTFAELVHWMYRAFERGEPVTVVIRNTI